MDKLDSTPVYVTGATVRGLEHMNSNIIKAELKDIFRSKNMRELLSNVSSTKETLSNLGVFKKVAIGIDTDSHIDRGDGYSVLLVVEESKRTKFLMKATTNTENIVKAGIDLFYLNVFGNAETFSLSSSFGSNHLAQYNMEFYKPLALNANVKMMLNAEMQNYDSPLSRFRVSNTRFDPGLTFKTKLGFHQINFINNWRETSHLGLDTPKVVLMECGSQFYRGLSHVFSSDSRPIGIFPDSGFHFSLKSELVNITPGTTSGLHDPSKQPNQNSSVQCIWKGRGGFATRLAHWLVAEINFESRLAYSFTGHPIPIGDRFFFGGPLEFRGFQQHSLGPKAPLLRSSLFIRSAYESNPSGDSKPDVPSVPIGAPGSWLSGLHLYTPLPLFGDRPGSFASLFRIHLFLLSGSTIDLTVEQTKSRNDLFAALRGFPRVMTGIGIVMKFADAIRIEFNYCIPIRYKDYDLIKPGFQFGIGLNHT